MLNAEKFPALKGSEKQIAWANRLRLEAYSVIVPTLSGLERQLATTSDEQQKSILSALIGAYSWFFLQTHLDAKWWIENRQGNPHDWERAMYTPMEAYLREQHLPVDVLFFEGQGWKVLPKRNMDEPLIPLPKKQKSNFPDECEACGAIPLRLDDEEECIDCGAYYGGRR